MGARDLKRAPGASLISVFSEQSSPIKRRCMDIGLVVLPSKDTFDLLPQALQTLAEKHPESSACERR